MCEIIAYNEGNEEYGAVHENQILNVPSLITNISSDCTINEGDSIVLTIDLLIYIEYNKILWFFNNEILSTNNDQNLLLPNATRSHQGVYRALVHTDYRSEFSKLIKVVVKPNAKKQELRLSNKKEVESLRSTLEALSTENFYKKLMYNSSQTNYELVLNMVYNDYYNKLQNELFDYITTQLNKIILYLFENNSVGNEIQFFKINTSKLELINLNNYEFSTSSVRTLYEMIYNNCYDSIYKFISNKILYKLLDRILIKKIKCLY